MTPQEAGRLLLGAAWRCGLILLGFVVVVLFAPALWPNG